MSREYIFIFLQDKMTFI